MGTFTANFRGAERASDLANCAHRMRPQTTWGSESLQAGERGVMLGGWQAPRGSAPLPLYLTIWRCPSCTLYSKPRLCDLS